MEGLHVMATVAQLLRKPMRVPHVGLCWATVALMCWGASAHAHASGPAALVLGGSAHGIPAAPAPGERLQGAPDAPALGERTENGSSRRPVLERNGSGSGSGSSSVVEIAPGVFQPVVSNGYLFCCCSLECHTRVQRIMK